ncbi:MAG: response regulator [Bacteroidales bacterium]|nr:response regulator [Bacteroidales bacterium]
MLLLITVLTFIPALAQLRYSNGYVLVLTSYSQESNKVINFVSDLDETLAQSGLEFGVKVEKLGYGALNEINNWHSKMHEILDKQDLSKLKAIILLGQEAWAVYISLNGPRPEVPFYGNYISTYGVIIPEYVENYSTWEPLSIDTKIYADSKGRAGAVMNNYDFSSNIKLILSIYPKVKKIAFLSDNTYGGVSLQANFKKTMKEKFKNLEPILLDGRKYSVEDIHQKINELPQDAVLLLGSWLVDNKGTYFMTRDIPYLVSDNPKLPVFTISGIGIENVAIGGFVPSYELDSKFIINDIKRFYSGTDNGKSYKYNSNDYKFRSKALKQMDIHENILPQGYKIIDSSDVQLEEYKKNNRFLIIISIIGIVATFVILLLLIKNKQNTNKLKIQSKELAIAKEDAEKSDKLKSAFLANMSHEIRTPLNAIIGFSSLMIDANDNQKQEYYKIINTNSEILLKLVDEIVDFSKIESGLIELKYQKFNISEYFRELKKTLSLNKPDNIDFICEIPYYNCEINYDKERLSQLVNNLVNNAFKFTPQGRVTMGFKLEKQGIIIYVSDTGIGIAKENYKRVFQRFEKISPFIQGAGLGLSVCKAIVEKSKGLIEIESEIDHGTIFNVHIPCEVSFSKDIKNENISLIEQKETNKILNVALKILYAEDNESNSTLVKHILYDYQVIHVNNGQKAVEAMQNDWFDLVLMDIKMPEMDGIEAVKAIRLFDKSTPIIALSAYAYNSDRQIAIDAGFNDFITKPFSKNKLFSVIEKLM